MRFGHAKRHPVAHMANLILHKEGACRPIGRWASGVFRHKERRQAAETAMSDIVARENAQGAWRLQGPRRIDRFDASVSMARINSDTMSLPGEVDVVHITA